MDYFAAGGSDEGLSLQDMIENDFRSNFAEHGEKIGGQLSSVHQLNNVEYLEVNDGGAISVDISDASKLDLSWIHGMSIINGHMHDLGSPENTDPNLLVDPSTGMPISEANPGEANEGGGAGISPRDAMTGHTASASQTLNRVNTVTALPASRIIHTAQGQFITIPTTLAAAASAPITHIQYVPAASPSSPLRQHLQNISQAPHSPMSLDYVPQSPKTPKNNKANTKVYPKPVYSYSCLIAMALKNSETGCLPVSEIYNFMTENFPYFKTAPDGWKNSVRHNLSLNKCFEKIENPKSNGNTKKGCLWTMNPAKIEKMDEEIAKWRKKDPISIKKSMSKPEVLDQLEKGNPHCGSPRHLSNIGNNSAPSTPTRSHAQNNNNNNNSKVEGEIISLSNSHSVARAVRNLSNITGNFNVIEIKQEPSTPQNNAVKVEDHSSLSNLTSDDLNILENGLTLDPTLSDLALQNGLFDDFNHDDLSIDIPGTASPLSFTFTSNGLSSSPLTIGSAGLKEEAASVMFSSGAITSAVSTTSETKPIIARTISAPT